MFPVIKYFERAFWIFGNVMEFPKVIPDPPLRNVKIFPDIILVKSGLGLKKNLNWNARILWSRIYCWSNLFFCLFFSLLFIEDERWKIKRRRKVCLKGLRITGSGKGASVTIVAKLIIPEYEMIKKGGKNLFESLSLSLGHTRVSNSKAGTSRHGPREQWRSLEILYVSATSPVKGGRKELAELKGTMFNPTLQPPVESFDEV